MAEPIQYPRWRYHATKPDTLVNNEKEEKALGAGWFDNPGQARPSKTEPTPAEQIAAANAPPKAVPVVPAAPKPAVPPTPIK